MLIEFGHKGTTFLPNNGVVTMIFFLKNIFFAQHYRFRI